MTELTVQCDCGQNYQFEVEPVNNQMPCPVACPSCGVDGTEKANALLHAQAPAPEAAPALPSSGLRLSTTLPQPTAPPTLATAAAQRYPSTAAPSRAPVSAGRPSANTEGTSNLGIGILGAVIGAAIGAGLMYGFFALAGVRFPLMGTGVGALTGLGARILYRGTDSALGAISGGVAAAAVFGALFLMYGEVPVSGAITAIFGIYFAYRIAA
jgi:hypothetical protein